MPLGQIVFYWYKVTRYNRLSREAGRDNKRREAIKLKWNRRFDCTVRQGFYLEWADRGNGEDTAEDRHESALTTSVRSGELTPLNRRLPRAVGQGWADDNHATESNGHRSSGFEETISDPRVR